MRDISVIQPQRPYASLPKKNKAFIEVFVKTGDAVEAYRAAGYKADSSRIRAKARKLRDDLSQYIEPQFREYIESTDTAIVAFGVLKELAISGESEAVRKDCAKEILNRAGYNQATEVHHKHETVQSDAQVLERVQQLRKELLEEKVVSEQ